MDSAADKRLTSRSDYIRVALLDRLRADGIEPAPAGCDVGLKIEAAR